MTKKRKDQIWTAAKEDQRRIREVILRLKAFQSRRDRYRDKEDRTIFATANASELAHLYTGIESLLEKALRLAGTALPETRGNYHAQLLEAAKKHEVIQEDSHIGFLNEIRTFRHFQRNAYGIVYRDQKFKRR